MQSHNHRIVINLQILDYMRYLSIDKVIDA